MTRFGTFDGLLALTAAPLRPVATALRARGLTVQPAATEVVRRGDRAAG